MQVTKVNVIISRKINIGNYETKDFSVSAEANLEDGETVFDVSNRLKQSLEHLLEGWEMEEKGITPKISSANDLVDEITIENPHHQETENFMCPVCKEPMKKKEGKEYFTCSKHWGYPAMIQRGDVREKTFNNKSS